MCKFHEFFVQMYPMSDFSAIAKRKMKASEYVQYCARRSRDAIFEALANIFSRILKLLQAFITFCMTFARR